MKREAKRRKREALLLLVCLIGLVLLFLASSTDLLIKEQEKEIFHISIIIEETGDENYVNFRKGVEQAAADLNVDVSFVTLYESNQEKQQLAFFRREQQDGAQAIVLVPVGKMKSIVEESKSNSVPLLLVNTEQQEEDVYGLLSPDYRKMGEDLAKEIGRDWESDTLVCLIGEERQSGVSQSFGEALSSALEEAGFHTEILVKGEEESLEEALEREGWNEEKRFVAVALEPGNLEEMAELLSEGGSAGSRIGGLYGRGSRISILNYLDKRIITGIMVTDEFSEGYLSVRYAVEAIRKQPSIGVKQLESYYIEKEDLRKAEYEKMLYPIE
ncbi:MAG: substrate-binding domain-containing protein [bacterium]|nr:substrate-binding domain-containing protein [bacterium]